MDRSVTETPRAEARMFEKQSLTTRIMVGKGLGLAVGLLGFILMPLFLPGADGILQSPFWIAAEGAIAGFVIGYFATRFGGEGKEIAGRRYLFRPAEPYWR